MSWVGHNFSIEVIVMKTDVLFPGILFILSLMLRLSTHFMCISFLATLLWHNGWIKGLSEYLLCQSCSCLCCSIYQPASFFQHSKEDAMHFPESIEPTWYKHSALYQPISIPAFLSIFSYHPSPPGGRGNPSMF